MQRPQPGSRLSLVPPRALDQRGNPRAIGVEIEFSGLDLEAASQLLVNIFGGTARRVHEYAMFVAGTELGDFRVTIDSAPLSAIAERRKRRRPLSLYARLKEAVLGSVVGSLTPVEIATPPLPFERLPEIDRLARGLRRAGAHGTRDSLLYVYGVHFNPTAPGFEPQLLLDFIRAYVLLHAFLVRALRVDLARRVTRFATAYPVAYARRVLEPSYAPDLGQLIDDYLAYNPTRNRALDLLPLFAHLDAPRVRCALDDPRVKPRPTFHFRLPNSALGDPAFRISDEWRLWLEVERLADDRARLARLSARARERLRIPLVGIGGFRGLSPWSAG